MKALASILFVAACAAPTAYKSDVESVLASHPPSGRQLAAPTTLVPTDTKPGTWLLYRTTHAGQVGYQLVNVTSGACGVWFEFVWGTADHRTISKVCYASMPDFAAGIDHWPQVEIAVTKVDHDPPLVVDLRDGHENDRVAGHMPLDQFQANMDSARWRHADLPRENVDVPAGHFGAAIRAENHAHTVTQWFHPGVPVTNLVRSHTADGDDVELVAWGDAGAASVLPNVPRP